MNERIKALRKALNLNQTEFAERIGLKQSAIAGYETGTRTPIDAILNSIAKEYGVNIDWLKNGDGDMFSPHRDELAEIVSRFMDNESDEFNQLLLQAMRAYQELDDKNRKIILDFVKKLKG